MSRLLSFLLLLAVVFGATPAFSADRKKEKLPVPPPQPVAQEVTVKRGDSIDIRLSIYGRKYENLKYLIRTAPEHGKVGEPRMVTQEAGIVTYRSPANVAVKHDRFTYAVQNSAGVSAAVEVGVTIVDEASQLIAPDLLDFAPLLAGGAALKEMEISNIGGFRLRGRSAGLGALANRGSRGLQARGGRAAEVPGLLRAENGGRVARRTPLHLAADARDQPARRVRCRLCRLARELRLSVASGSTVRAGRLEVTNHTPTEQVLTVTASPRLQAPESITIAAGGKEAVTVSVKEGDPASSTMRSRSRARAFRSGSPSAPRPSARC